MKRILPIVGLVAALLLVGTIGLHLITHRSILECLYLSVVTLTTVGSREPTDVSGEPIADGGIIFMIIYLVCGAGTFGYLITLIGRWMISEQVRNALEKRKMQQIIDKISGHMIVCGCGQMGEMICRNLAEQRRDFIVIDSNLERLEELCVPEGWTYLHGDATDDGMLERAGLIRASGLAAVLSTDADNLYVVLSAKLDNNNLAIVARAAEESASRKLRQAGASHVINPYHAGAVRIARLLIHPGIENLLDIVDGHHADLELAEFPVPAGGLLEGKSISKSSLPERGLTVIAIRRANGERRMPVSGGDQLHAGDSILVVGQQEAVQEFLAETSVPGS
ncbi:MAG: hypothetical protein CMJ69_03965 [Planctomycetaceae bacterium]|nr:hypothetical protein [Planctomycetaceae bacterium]